MPDKWVTLAEAAAALKVHPRTVERQMKSGKLQSRRTDAGQLEVMIEVPDEVVPAPDALSVVAGQADNQVQLALGATSALVQNAHEDARLARLDADKAWRETQIARRGATIAWGTVGTMAAALMVAIWWTSSTITRTQVQLQHADEQVKTMSDTAGQLRQTNDKLASDLATARQDAAHAQGELSGRVAIDDKTYQVLASHQHPAPATQPSGLLERLANILSGPPSDTPGQ